MKVLRDLKDLTIHDVQPMSDIVGQPGGHGDTFTQERWSTPFTSLRLDYRPGGNPGANLKSISHKCYLVEVVFVWGLTKETID